MIKIKYDFNLFWFLLALISLFVSGLYSLAVVAMRSPAIYNLFPNPNFFSIPLVIHVTLSINTWFILFAFYNLSHLIKNTLIILSTKICASIGIALIIASGFVPGTKAITINYIPVLNNLLFYFGIGIFLMTFYLFLVICFITQILNIKKIGLDIKSHLEFWIVCSGLASFKCLFIYYIKCHHNFDLEEFFWGCGHLMQLMFVELAILCAFRGLSEFNQIIRIDQNIPYLKRMLYCLNILKAFALIITPIFYLNDSWMQFFTIHMRYGALIFLLPLPLLLIIKLFKNNSFILFNESSLSFILGILLSLYGGIIGYMINVSNVTIPAHYHGSLIGITVIIMGFFYANLLFYKHYLRLKPLLNKLIIIQIILYSFGHFAHVLGLVMMGGYGALRKTPGDVTQNTSGFIKFAKLIFFSGGGLSMIGGLMFIFIGSYLLLKKYNNEEAIKLSNL